MPQHTTRKRHSKKSNKKTGWQTQQRRPNALAGMLDTLNQAGISVRQDKHLLFLNHPRLGEKEFCVDSRSANAPKSLNNLLQKVIKKK